MFLLYIITALWQSQRKSKERDSREVFAEQPTRMIWKQQRDTNKQSNFLRNKERERELKLENLIFQGLYFRVSQNLSNN